LRVKSVLTTDALLLRATDYRDTDRVVTLFTRDCGKLSAIARGARGSKRRFAGSLEPYSVIRVEVESGRGELLTLKRAEIVQTFPAILTGLSRMEAAGAALALVRESRAIEVVDPALFVSVLQYLTVVDHEGDPQRGLLLAFAVRVLALSGCAPRLSVCGRSSEAVPANKPAYFDPQIGAVVGRRFGGGPFLLSAGTRARLTSAQGEDWLRDARDDWNVEDLRQARGAIAAFVGLQLSPGLGSRLFA
jgi:DNA repair protein RecO